MARVDILNRFTQLEGPFRRPKNISPVGASSVSIAGEPERETQDARIEEDLAPEAPVSQESWLDVSDPQFKANLALLLGKSNQRNTPLVEHYLQYGSKAVDDAGYDSHSIKNTLEKALLNIAFLMTASSDTVLMQSELAQTLQRFCGELQDGNLYRDTIIDLLKMPQLEALIKQSGGERKQIEAELLRKIISRIDAISTLPALREYLEKLGSSYEPPRSYKELLKDIREDLKTNLVGIQPISLDAKKVLYISGINLSESEWDDDYAIIRALFSQRDQIDLDVVDQRVQEYLAQEYPKIGPQLIVVLPGQLGTAGYLLGKPFSENRVVVDFPQYNNSEVHAPIGDGSDHKNNDEREALSKYFDWLLLTQAELYKEQIDARPKKRFQEKEKSIKQYIAEIARTFILQANDIIGISDQIAKLQRERDIRGISSKDLADRQKKLDELEAQWQQAVQKLNEQINLTSPDGVRVLPDGLALLDEATDRRKVTAFIKRIKGYVEGAVLYALPKEKQAFQDRQIELLVPAKSVGFLFTRLEREIPEGFIQATESFNSVLESSLVKPIVLSDGERMDQQEAQERARLLETWISYRIQLEILLGSTSGVEKLLQGDVFIPDSEIITGGLRQLLEAQVLASKRESSDKFLDWQFSVKSKMTNVLWDRVSQKSVPTELKSAFKYVLNLIYSNQRSINASFLTDLVVTKRDPVEQSSQDESPQNKLSAFLRVIELMMSYVEEEKQKIQEPTQPEHIARKAKLKTEVIQEALVEIHKTLYVLEFMKMKLKQASDLLQNIRELEDQFVAVGIVTLPKSGKREEAFRLVDGAASNLITAFDAKLTTPLSTVRSQGEDDPSLFRRFYQSYMDTHVFPELANIQAILDEINAPAEQ